MLHYHHVEDKTKAFLISAITLVLAAILSIGLSAGLWKENKRLNANSVKFRMIRQSFPTAAQSADTTYYANPEKVEQEKVEQETERLEVEQLAIAQAEAEAEQKKNNAEKAKKKADRLKDRRIK